MQSRPIHHPPPRLPRLWIRLRVEQRDRARALVRPDLTYQHHLRQSMQSALLHPRRRARAARRHLHVRQRRRARQARARAHPGARAVLRILTDDSKSLCAFGIKFGAPLSAVPALLQRAKELGG